MTQFRFKVVPPRTKNPSVIPPAFVLEQDNWNDYSFQTQYHLTYYASSTEVTLVGAVKILRRGQTKADTLQVTADFDQLDESFCSVGQSFDYYERLRQLGPIGQEVLTALRDVVAREELVDQFSEEDGWATSLFRDQKDEGRRFRLLAPGFLQGHYAVEPTDQQSFSFAPAGWQSPLEVDTTSPPVQSGWTIQKSLLPERVNVVVGRNGSGKSTLLARLARVAYASPDERLLPPVSGLGKLTPEGVGFARIVSVAFSPFDSFRLPGSDDRNRLQIAKDMSRGVGRYSFIGLRDIGAEVEQLSDTGLPVAGQDTLPNDRVTQTRLKSIEQLAEEFSAYAARVFEKSREGVLKQALNSLERGFFDFDWSSLGSKGQIDEARRQFLHCSTGHKISLLVVFGLIANLEVRSLVLLDEPETHLHPPLLAAMMHALRGILDEFESMAVVATHSPVVVQESLARHVHLVRRVDNLTAVLPMNAETFGESIGHITAQVFGLESEATDFHKVLDALVERHGSLETVEALFMDGMMSSQARAYVLTRLAS